VCVAPGRRPGRQRWSRPRLRRRLSFLFNQPVPTRPHRLSLHDALPISIETASAYGVAAMSVACLLVAALVARRINCHDVLSRLRSEEHTSELQSPYDIVCRLLPAQKSYPSTSLKTGSTEPIIATPSATL